MSATLATIALNAGLPIIEKILAKRLGDTGGQLATQVLRKIAEALHVAPEEVETVAETQPGAVIDAMREVERMTPELVGLYAAELQMQLATFEGEQDEPMWARLWRPGGMYLIGFLWLWNITILHIANAFWHIALPVAPFDVLMGLSALYFSLYMGGHTVKDLVGKWVAK